MTTTATPTEILTGRGYWRVSFDRSGRERSQSEQLAEAVPACDRHGIALNGPHYLDTGSASEFATRVRGDFTQLVADLEADRFGANVLILWESSRISRDVEEGARFFKLLRRRGIKIFIVTHSRLYDPEVRRDRKSLHEDLVDDADESAKISERIQRARNAEAAGGKIHGVAPYGYKRVHTVEGTTRHISQVPHPVEAEIVRELFARLREGHSLRAISRDFEDRGIVSRRGKALSGAVLRSMAMNPAYAAYREVDGRYVEGVWEPIVRREIWHSVRELLTAPERKKFRPGRAKHLLGNIAVCDLCSGPLSPKTRGNGSLAYGCHARGCVSVDRAELDAYVQAAILAYLQRPDHAEHLTAEDDKGDEIQAARDEVARVRAEHLDLVAQVGSGALSATLAAAAEPEILERLKAAEARLANLTAPPALRGLIEPGEDVAQRWAAAELSTKREIARLVLSPGLLGQVRITRAVKRGQKSPIQDRVIWHRDVNVT